MSTTVQATSTYNILSTFWNTEIAMCCLFGSLVMAIMMSLTTFVLKKYYPDLVNNSPFIRPIVSVLCLITAISVAWLIQTFSNRDKGEHHGNISYFVLSIASFFGRFVYESVHHHEVLYKGLFYLIGFNALGNLLGFAMGVSIMYLYDKGHRQEKHFSFKLTYYYKPIKTSVSVIKDIIVWLIFGAIAPFVGYIAVYENQYFTPFTSILLILFVVTVTLFATQKFGFYNGNLIYSSCSHLSNVFFFKHEERKTILKNIIISYPITIAFPAMWGAVYAVL